MGSLLLIVLVEDGLSPRSSLEHELVLSVRRLVDHVANRLLHEIALNLASLHFIALPLVFFLHLLDKAFELGFAVVAAFGGQHEAEFADLFVVGLGLHEHRLQLLGETGRALTL